MFDERRYNGEIAAAREGGKADICKAMLDKGFPKETVAEIAGLTVAELDDLISRY